jgi:hypothetical protein
MPGVLAARAQSFDAPVVNRDKTIARAQAYSRPRWVTMTGEGKPRPSDLLSINPDRVYYFFVARRAGAHCGTRIENQSNGTMESRSCGNSATSKASLLRLGPRRSRLTFRQPNEIED